MLEVLADLTVHDFEAERACHNGMLLSLCACIDIDPYSHSAVVWDT
jgi:hypothetical protein